MGAELLPVWNQVKRYLQQGISVMPVRDRQEGEMMPKTPYSKWQKWQKEIIDEKELWHLMDERYNTTGVAIIGGAVSGNLLVFDIDSKNYHGIGEIILKDLQQLFPALFPLLRIHKTPSGGMHILFRCTGPVPGNQKLASRLPTEIEIEANPKAKPQCFIETRGEGGYVLAPPSMGYSVLDGFDNVPPVVSTPDMENLVGFMRSYNQVMKVERVASSEKQATQIYDTNPFADFDLRCDPVQVAEDQGWKFEKENSRFIYFTRPGKSSGTSMSWNRENRVFWCFTSSTGLDESRGYKPAKFIEVLQFNGDKKALYRHLVNMGYGVIKPAVERKLVEQAARNTKIELPGNISQQAANLSASIQSTLQEAHPYGIFWVDDPVGGISIDREKLYTVSSMMGFRLTTEIDLVRIDGNLLTKQDERDYYDSIKAYIHEEDAMLYNDICNAFEAFIERHGRFTISRLMILQADLILEDTRTSAYKFFKNGVVHITAQSIRLQPYSDFADKLIWKHEIRDREYKTFDGGKFVEFLQLATGMSEYVMKVLGFLCGGYKDETTGYIPVFVDQVENPKDGGGSGKNVLANLLALSTTYMSKPGSQVKFDEKFYNSWNGQKVFCLSDVNKHFDFAFTKELSTGAALVKKLFKNEYVVPVEKTPKLLVLTNYGIDIKDGGVRRRVMPVEFTPFFQRAEGVDVYFNALFPHDWTEDDWNGYYTCISKCIQAWIAGGLKLKAPDLSHSMWMKQWRQEFGQVATDLILSNMEAWRRYKFVKNEDFNNMCEAFYTENATPRQMRPSLTKINDAITEYCKMHRIQFVPSIIRREGYFTHRCRFFAEPGEAPF